MYASIRRYTGIAPGLFDEVARRHTEIEAVMKQVPGLAGWYLIRTAEGMTTVTLCADEAAAQESVRLAVGWVRENMPTLAANPPDIANGEVVLRVAG
jgi:hypothetical protein